MMSVFCAMLTRSTGTIGGERSSMSSFACEKVKSVAAMMPTWSKIEAISPRWGVSPCSVDGSMRGPRRLFLVRFRLCGIRYEPDVCEAGCAQEPHDFHHAAIVDRLVAAHEDALVVAIGRDRAQSRD